MLSNIAKLLIAFLTIPALAQHGGTSSLTAVANVVFTATLSSNGNSTGLVATPSRKQLGNVGTGCDGSGNITPSGVPVGQLYATTAIQTAAEGATPACATQGVVTVTSSGTGIASMDNGQGAGGTDSPTALTDTYGGTSDDSVCTGDPNNTLPTIVIGLAAAPCVANGTLIFQMSTATSFGNADVLLPTLYASNSTTLDTALYYYRDIYFYIGKLSTLHDFEFDINKNVSPTAYGVSQGGYFGWGMHWNTTVGMFQYCPQNCSSWKTLTGVDITGVNGNLTSYPFINNHYYHVRNYGHHLPVASCSFSSGSNCYFYDYLTVYDVTAATAPITYRLQDAVSGLPAGGIPINHSTWTSGVVPQVQLDMTTANDNTSVHVISDTIIFYNLQ